MNRSTVILFCFILFCCCSKDDINKCGEVTRLSPIWTFNLHDGNVQGNSNIHHNFIYGDICVLPTTKDGKIGLTAVDLSSGQEMWHWDDQYSDDIARISFVDGFPNGDKLFFYLGSDFYNIDLISGRTVWKKQDRTRYIGGRGISFDDRVLLLGRQVDTLESYASILTLHQVNLQNRNSEQILVPNIPSIPIIDNKITSFDAVLEYKNGGRQYLVLTENDPFSNSSWNLMLGLYNYSDKEWIYNRKEIVTPTQALFASELFIENDRLFVFVNRSIMAVDIFSGEVIWERESLNGTSAVNGGHSNKGIHVEDDKLMIVGINGDLTILDTSNGGLVNFVETDATTSTIRYMDGIVYLIAGGDLLAIDTDQGEIVWRIDGRAYSDDRYDFRLGTLYVVGGQNGNKGKVIAATSEKAFCFEAYR